MSNTLAKIQEIFRDILDNDSIVIDENFSMQTNPDWDSVVTVQLVLAIESEFGVKFTTDEVASLESVADILKKLG